MILIANSLNTWFREGPKVQLTFNYEAVKETFNQAPPEVQNMLNNPVSFIDHVFSGSLEWKIQDKELMKDLFSYKFLPKSIPMSSPIAHINNL